MHQKVKSVDESLEVLGATVQENLRSHGVPFGSIAAYRLSTDPASGTRPFLGSMPSKLACVVPWWQLPSKGKI